MFACVSFAGGCMTYKLHDKGDKIKVETHYMITEEAKFGQNYHDLELDKTFNNKKEAFAWIAENT